MKKSLFVSACALTLAMSFVERALADGSEAEVTGDKQAPAQVDSDPVKLSHATAAARVRSAGVSIHSSGGCSNRSNPRCTSLDQVNSATIDSIITLKRASGCVITITGGTETGYPSGPGSHWNGYKLDIAITSCIDDYIHKNFGYQGKRSDGAPLYKSAAGNLYANEHNHWDISFGPLGDYEDDVESDIPY